MIKIDDIIDVTLLPKNEAEYPEIVKVKIKQQLPLEDKLIFVAELLMQTKQDFGYFVGEYLIVNAKVDKEKSFAYCETSLMESA